MAESTPMEEKHTQKCSCNIAVGYIKMVTLPDFRAETAKKLFFRTLSLKVRNQRTVVLFFIIFYYQTIFLEFFSIFLLLIEFLLVILTQMSNMSVKKKLK